MSREFPLAGPSRIVENRRTGPGWYVLRLHEPAIAAASLPGRFVQIRCAEGESCDPLLRRPFSVYDADTKAGTYDILYTPVGRGTRWMEGLLAEGTGPSGDRPPSVDIEGPFGNAFSMPDSRDRVYLVGGGVGVAPLYFLARRVLAPGAPGPRPDMTLCMGARTAPQLQGIAEFRKLPMRSEVSTDDGSEGFRGRVTELFLSLLEREPDPARVKVYGCGPQAMNESLRAIAVERGVRCEICLESLMGCGFGVCFACVAPIRKELGGDYLNRRICWEGPVFDARLLHPGIDG